MGNVPLVGTEGPVTPREPAAAPGRPADVRAQQGFRIRPNATKEELAQGVFDAVNNMEADVLAHLIRAGGPVNVFSKDLVFRGFTPLMLAATNGDLACVTILLNAGAEAFHKAPVDGSTALHFACLRGAKGLPPPDEQPSSIVDVVATLLHAAPDIVDVLDKAGNSALLLTTAASLKASRAMLALPEDRFFKPDSGVFLADGDADYVTFCGQNEKKLEIVSLLLAHGSHVDQTNLLGETPLIHAAAHGDVDIVRVLITAGANVNYKNTVMSKHGTTALSVAQAHGHSDVVRMLIGAGARNDPRANRAHSVTPALASQSLQFPPPSSSAPDGSRFLQ